MRTRNTQNCHLTLLKVKWKTYMHYIQRHAYTLHLCLYKGYENICIYKAPIRATAFVRIGDDRYDFLFLNADAFYQIYIYNLTPFFLYCLNIIFGENRNPQSSILFWSDNRDPTYDNALRISYIMDMMMAYFAREYVLRNLHLLYIATMKFGAVNYSENSNGMNRIR